MMEICFSPSCAGNLLLRRTASLGDIICPELYLSVGDLSEGVFSKKRVAAVADIVKGDLLYNRTFFGKRYWDKAKDAINEIRQRAENGEKIRIWYYTEADSVCAMMYLVSELADTDTEIALICIDCEDEAQIELSRTFTNFTRDQINYCVENAKVLGEADIKSIRDSWDELTSQSYPLRAYENGRVFGVPEDYYDEMIERNIPAAVEFTAVKVMDSVLRGLDLRKVNYSLLEKRLAMLMCSGRYSMRVRTEYSPHDEVRPLLERMYFRKIKSL